MSGRRFFTVFDLENGFAADDYAAVAHLPAAFGVEGGGIQNDGGFHPFGQGIYGLAVLVQKGEEAADAREAVGWLKELHLLDDRETARQLAASAAAKGYGKSRIKNILFEKGIPQELWEEALAELPEMDDAIDRFLLRRWQGKDPDEKEVKRTVDALIRRGHSWKDIQSGLRRYRVGLELEEITEDDIS